MKNSTEEVASEATSVFCFSPFSRCLIGFCAVNETGDVAYTSIETTKKSSSIKHWNEKLEMIFRFMTKWNFLIYFFFLYSYSPHHSRSFYLLFDLIAQIFTWGKNVGKFLLLPSLPPMSPKNNKIKKKIQKQQKILIFRYQKKG